MSSLVLSAVLDRLRGGGLIVTDDIPQVTPGVEYVIVTIRAPISGARRMSGDAPTQRVDVTVKAVSKTREGCRDTLAAAAALLDSWRPTTHTATSPLYQLDAGPMLPDGPAGDLRYSQTSTFRCAVPRGTPQRP